MEKWGYRVGERDLQYCPQKQEEESKSPWQGIRADSCSNTCLLFIWSLKGVPKVKTYFQCVWGSSSKFSFHFR